MPTDAKGTMGRVIWTPMILRKHNADVVVVPSIGVPVAALALQKDVSDISMATVAQVKIQTSYREAVCVAVAFQTARVNIAAINLTKIT